MCDCIMAPCPSRPAWAKAGARLGTLATTLVPELRRVGMEGHSAIEWLRRLVSVAGVHKDFVGNKAGGATPELLMCWHATLRAESKW